MHSKRVINFILIISLCLITFAVYANSLKGEFLIDDYTGILNNRDIHDIKEYFLKHFSIGPGVLNELTRVFLWSLSGAKPYLFHLCSVILHASCVILIFILCNILFNNRILSFLSGLIFAVHPIHAEAVSWISGSHYILASIFFITALIFYIREDRRLLNIFVSMVLFGLGLLAGNTVITLPVMFIIYDLFFREKTAQGKIFSKGLKPFLLFLVCLVSAIFLWVYFLGRNKFIHTIFYFRGPSYLIVVAKAFIYYLKILYLPLARGLYHTFAYNTTDINKLTPAFFFSLIIIAISVYLFFKCRKKDAPISFGIAWFFITYLPYSNIIPICNIVSERYMYLPSLGPCIIMAYLFLKAWKIINENNKFKKFLRIIAMLAIVLFIGSYAILTIKHNYEYKDLITYWESNINNFPDGYMAYNNLAGTLYTIGDTEQAIAYSWINLMINAKQPHVWCNLGKVYRERNDFKMAKYCYQEALKLDKGFLPARQGLADIEKKLKKNKIKTK